MCAIARGSLRLTRAHAIGVAGLKYLLPAVQRIARNAYAFNQHNEEPVQQSKVHMHMHENNIVHLDIKPENIMINDDLEVWLSDLGLAIRMPSSGYY